MVGEKDYYVFNELPTGSVDDFLLRLMPMDFIVGPTAAGLNAAKLARCWDQGRDGEDEQVGSEREVRSQVMSATGAGWIVRLLLTW